MQLERQIGALKTTVLKLGIRRIAALAAVGISVVAGIGAIAHYASRPETDPLYSGLAQADVARIGAALREAGIPFDVSIDGTKVLVRRSQAPLARMLLAEKGLPAGSTAGYELFDKLGPLGLTSFMQEVTRARALEGELTRTIQTMKGVKSARVHVVLSDTGSLRRSKQPASASVVIRTEGPRDPAMSQIIRHLVAAAVPGLPSSQVTVMSTDGTVLAAAGDETSLVPTKLLELERLVGNQLQENVRRSLAPYLGLENFEISIAPRINADRRQTNEQIFDPESKSERSTRVTKETGQSQNSATRQSASVEQNIPSEQGQPGGGDQSRKSNEKREELTNYELSSRTISTVSEGHRIESLNVSLVINRKRIEKQNGGSDAAGVDKRIKEIEALVASAVGLDAKRGDKMSVLAVDFIDAPAETGSTPSALERLFVHLDTIIIAITALAGLVILVWAGMLPAIRTIIARPADALSGGALTPPSPTLPSPGDTAAPSLAQPSAPGQQEVKIEGTKGNPAQKRLADLIERDEQQVAEILKQWLLKTT